MRLCPTDGTVLEGGQAPRDENVGRSLDGKYRLDKRLSSGGMGTVYKATHLMLGKALAVKLIKADLPASPDVVRRFQREAKAASNLNHPNIVPAYDLGQTQDGTLYIAMEYIDGPSLKEVIQAGPIDPARTINLLRQVASALSLAHKHDIIHRDLKPQNIMLTKDADGRDVAKLLDFGIAKTLDDSATQLTATGFSLGTPQYMSPEQAYGRPVDGRSDLYSLGIILYEMLVGEVPFSDPSTPAVLVKQMTEAPIPPALKRPDRQISPELAAIALRCLEKDPAKRFQTADEFSAALDAAAASLGATVLPLPLPSQVVGTMPSTPTSATVVIGKPPSGQTTQLPTPVPAVSPANQTTRAAGAGLAAASDAATSTGGPTLVPPKAAQPPAASYATPPTAGAASPSAPALAPAPAPAPTRKSGSGSRAAVAAAVAILLLGGAAYGAFKMGLIGAGAKDAATATSAANASATPPAPQAASAATSDSSAAGGPPPSSAATDPANGAGGGTPASPGTPPGSSNPPASGAASGSSPAKTTHGPSANRPASGATSSGATASSAGSASAPAPGAATPAQTPSAAGAPAAPPVPANPSVAFRCAGPPDVCAALKSAVDQALAKDSMTSTRDAARADVALESAVTLVDEQTQTMFGTTFTVRNYTIDVSGEARASSDSVPMPSAATLNYDARYRDRLDEKARTVAADVVEHIRAYWKKRQP